MFPPIFSDLLSDKEASPNQQHPPFPPSPFASPFPAGTTIRRSLLAASATETRQKNPENSVNSRIVEGREIKIYIGSNAGWIGIRAISFRKRALFFFRYFPPREFRSNRRDEGGGDNNNFASSTVYREEWIGQMVG